jgi:hypothetical protein
MAYRLGLAQSKGQGSDLVVMEAAKNMGGKISEAEASAVTEEASIIRKCWSAAPSLAPHDNRQRQRRQAGTESAAKGPESRGQGTEAPRARCPTASPIRSQFYCSAG